MKYLGKNIISAIMVLFCITLIVSFFLDESAFGKVEKLTLNDVANKVNAGEIKKLTIEGSTVNILLENGNKAKATKETESGLIETLKNYGVKEESLQKVQFEITEEGGFKYWMGILLPILIPIIAMVFIFWFMFRKASAGANQAMTFGKANLKMFSNSKDKVTFKDVAGLKESKEELEEVVDFLKNPKKFLDMGAKIPRGVLLMGPPGCGKTLLARAVAGESNVPFFHMSASEFVEMFVGVGASRVRDLFQTAKKAAPSIIFVDEIDAVGRERGAGLGGGHDEREQTLNQILVEMDGFERDTNVIVVAATNRPDILDQALLRPGRFDRRVMLDSPDIRDREEILKIHAKGKPLEEGVDLARVAVRTPGFSGADLANLMNEAAIVATRLGKKTISQDDILNSIEKVMLGPARRSRVISKKEKEITAYHEAGHALVAASLKDADPVQKVSIISRGMAGGYTIKLPTEDRHLKSRMEFLADLAVSYGGFLAEKIIFKDVTTGASSDIRHATEMAHSMVTEYGMSEVLGPRTFGKRDDLIFLGKEITAEKDYSEKIGSTIDDEVNKILEKAQVMAEKIIAGNKKTLKEIAEALIKQETLEHEEFYKIFDASGIKKLEVR